MSSVCLSESREVTERTTNTGVEGGEKTSAVQCRAVNDVVMLVSPLISLTVSP